MRQRGDHFNTVILGHLSKENNYAELAYETVRLEVTMGENPYKGDDFPMYVAKRDAPSERIYFLVYDNRMFAKHVFYYI